MPAQSKMKLDLFPPQVEKVQLKEIKINPNIILEMAQKYKIPSKSKSSEAECISIEQTLSSLANNKHNDLTTTYYLLHKKWLNTL